jgi:hypothetical protein
MTKKASNPPPPLHYQKEKTMIKLGDKVKDRISSYQGIVIGITQWIFGCVRITVQSQELKDGKPVDSVCFDQQQLELIEENSLERKVDPPAGPRPDVKRF